MEIVKKIQIWLGSRTQRERAIVLAGILFVLSFIWFFLWESQYQDMNKAQITAGQEIEDKITSFKAQNKIMKRVIADQSLIAKREQLKKQLKEINIQINAVSSKLVSPAMMAQALKNILVQTPGLILLHLTNSEGVMLTAVDSQKANTIKLYQHNFILEFEGDYFSVLSYLKKLESSPFRFYTDSINYKVNQYPLAHIILSLHTVSKQKDLINEPS